MKWKRTGISPNNGPINEPLVDYLERVLDEEIEKGFELKVCVGTDSQKAGKGYNFATAIVIETSEFLGNEVITDELGNEEVKPLYVGRGAMVIGSTFWEEMKASTNKKKHREIEILNQRMLKEVSTSINIGYEIWPLLDLYGIPLEIHADINSDPRHPSNASVSEALGYITGMGWESRIKPDAYAASTGADKLC
jgi:predicted RNase H-related nuclease YkuK (DUF458 family)